MRKFTIFSVLIMTALSACSKSDPILPGTRVSIFPGSAMMSLGLQIPDLPENLPEKIVVNCPYTQDSSNVIWDGSKKIFSGFPTNNSVKSEQKPVCDGGFVYAGLTTGELVKINPKNRDIEWIADIYRESSMTGGASVLDIVAPIVIDGGNIYAGGLGDAFCKINKSSGTKTWCLDIGVALPFIVLDNAIFVVATNNMLYAVNTKNGELYWGQPVKKQITPKYKNKIITVGREKFDAFDRGNPIK